tara:strand:- start:311 stop:637 length:327 start_codon:yes stop_codon:yes gene_type:complete
MQRFILIGILSAILWGCSSTTLSEDPFACEFLKFPPSKELVIPEDTKITLLFVSLDKIKDYKGPNAHAVTFLFDKATIVWLPAGQVSKELMCLAWHEAQHAVQKSWHP